MADDDFPALEGGCDCRQVRYRLTSRPLFVHCCHCRWCQRESGTAFALNAMIESDRLQLLAGTPELVHTPSLSGTGQDIARCPQCRVAVWSHYGGAGPLLAFVRVGALDAPDRLPPDVHIFTASKQPWVQLEPGAPAFAEFYDRDTLWPAASLARRQALLPRIEAWQATRAAVAAAVSAPSAHAIIERYWAHANARDWAAFGALCADDVVYDVPQTRERVRGREAYVEFNRTWPGAWRAEVQRIAAAGDHGVSVIDFHVDGEVMTGITEFELQGGRIVRLTDHWPAAYEPPPRATDVIERY